MRGFGFTRLLRIKPRTRTEQLIIMHTVPALTGVRLEGVIPISGTITSIVPHFPLGCNALVEVALGHGTKQLLPSAGVIALDAATPMIPVSERVKEQEVLWATLDNTDGVNPHTISLIVTIER